MKEVSEVKINRPKKKLVERLPVDKEKWGINDNTYALPPEYYNDIEYDCCDCGKKTIWRAKDQKQWYEQLGKTINSDAKRCQICRAHINAIKEEQRRHMQEMAKKPVHPNTAFFKNKP